MTTFSDARTAVLAHIPTRWDTGDIVTAEDGFEDVDGFLVVYGRRDFIANGDIAAMLGDAPAALVDKKTGAAEFVPYLKNRERIDSMQEVRG